MRGLTMISVAALKCDDGGGNSALAARSWHLDYKYAADALARVSGQAAVYIMP